MKVLSQIKKWSLVTMLIAFVGGILFIAFPEQCLKYISIAVGGAFIAIGLVGIINYFIDKASSFSFAMGIIILIVGIIVCIKYRQLLSIILIIIGIFVLATGIVNFFTAIKVITSSMVFGWLTLVLSIVTIAFGVYAVTRSGELTNTIIQIMGAGLIVYSVLDLIAYIQVRQIVKDVNKTISQSADIETNASIVEESEE